MKFNQERFKERISEISSEIEAMIEEFDLKDSVLFSMVVANIEESDEGPIVNSDVYISLDNQIEVDLVNGLVQVAYDRDSDFNDLINGAGISLN